MTKTKRDPFFKTGFGYSYHGVGGIYIATSGHINAVIVKPHTIQAIFKTPIHEDYAIVAHGGKNIVCVIDKSKDGFSITSTDSENPIYFFTNVSAGITKISEKVEAKNDHDQA